MIPWGFYHSVPARPITWPKVPYGVSWRGIGIEDAAIGIVRRGCPTKTKLTESLQVWAAGGPRYQFLSDHIRVQKAVQSVISRLLTAGVIIRDQKWPHHLKLGV